MFVSFCIVLNIICAASSLWSLLIVIIFLFSVVKPFFET
ncbi:hypothetical protein BPP43_00255 [Brachyspira pilosicoli P43/6/78]|uniref:Uncharacterized protein n=1 Tax=Brachyspira pilosicoli P43/6/78 TaxID=1042417 RepID=A0A3B6VHJ2_BRAPL|nr:hypothetical protein BPP43_00255 [Brachyspira pilosicoli P43/6/78]